METYKFRYWTLIPQGIPYVEKRAQKSRESAGIFLRRKVCPEVVTNVRVHQCVCLLCLMYCSNYWTLSQVLTDCVLQLCSPVRALSCSTETWMFLFILLLIDIQLVTYHSLVKEHPWVEHLTSLPNGGGGGALLSVSAFNHERTPMSCFQRFNPFEANIWTNNNVQWNHHWLRSWVLMGHNSTMSQWAWCSSQCDHTTYIHLCKDTL